MIKIDNKTIRKIFSCNGVYDGKTFYLIESFKYCNEVTKEGYQFLYDVYSEFIEHMSSALDFNELIGSRKFKNASSFLGKYGLGEKWNIIKITNYVDLDMKALFKTKLLCSERKFITFNIVENEDNFDIDIDSIH